MLRHLAEQRAELATIDPAVADLIASIVEDEQLHHDRSLDEVNIDRGWLRGLRAIVSRSTEAVIWLGMKL